MESSSQIMEESDRYYRGWAIERDKRFGTFSVRKVGKGGVPAILHGVFQSDKLLRSRIDLFEDEKARQQEGRSKWRENARESK